MRSRRAIRGRGRGSKPDPRWIEILAEAEADTIRRAAAILEDKPGLLELPEELFRISVASCVRAALGPAAAPDADSSYSPGERPESEYPTFGRMLSAEQVGRVYEHLRGLHLVSGPDATLRLEPSAKGKRNQGLFYTPLNVVNHIVETTLDALSIDDPADCLELKILDPAVGAGVFLVAALDHLIKRIVDGAKRSPRVREALDAARARAATIFGGSPGDETAAGLHALENCLYAADTDQIAVLIARKALIEKVAQRSRPIAALKTRILNGNSLIGTAAGDPKTMSREQEDRAHAQAYLSTSDRSDEESSDCAKSLGMIHWPLEFPEVFDRNRPGFDAVIGNPPYEILSVRESGIRERTREQAYFRTMYKTCFGKINTYRLMIERGLELLRNRGVLGFIVPATLLGDSTAAELRRIILDTTETLETIVIPEKAPVFEGVTQALLIVVTRKGGRSRAVEPLTWDGGDIFPSPADAAISREVIEKAGFRIPLLKTAEERKLLALLSEFPTLGTGGGATSPCRVHQGEVNLTTAAAFVTYDKTESPLIRGEHVEPFLVRHPVTGRRRLDWVLPDFFTHRAEKRSRSGGAKRLSRALFRNGAPVQPWEVHRIVLARVVNMATERRLKAALIKPGDLLGDMTNYIADHPAPTGYLLGLLNSRLLNWRIKATSANNYLSAAEVEALPIPEYPDKTPSERYLNGVENALGSNKGGLELDLGERRALIGSLLDSTGEFRPNAVAAALIDRISNRILKEEPDGAALERAVLWIDALTLILYGAESYADVLQRGR